VVEVEVEVDEVDELPGVAVLGVDADVALGIPLFRTANQACSTFWPWV
jgi:hypothetical protein